MLTTTDFSLSTAPSMLQSRYNHPDLIEAKTEVEGLPLLAAPSGLLHLLILLPGIFSPQLEPFQPPVAAEKSPSHETFQKPFPSLEFYPLTLQLLIPLFCFDILKGFLVSRLSPSYPQEYKLHRSKNSSFYSLL